MYARPTKLLNAVVRRLPAWPPAAALASALNLVIRSRLSDAHKAMLLNRVVLIGLLDPTVECRIKWTGARFVPCASNTAHDVAIRAGLKDFHALACRAEDPDTLFFQRRLLIEGDTALGLGIKNLLDAIDPPAWLARLPQPRWLHRVD